MVREKSKKRNLPLLDEVGELQWKGKSLIGDKKKSGGGLEKLGVGLVQAMRALVERWKFLVEVVKMMMNSSFH